MLKQLLLAAAWSACSALAALAQVPKDVVEVSILPGWREADGSHVAGLSIRLADGWKTYWRAPGDGGIPPNFNWSGSKNLGAVEVRFPVPRVFEQNGLRSIGYDQAVVFPLLIQTKQAGRPVVLEGEIDLGICEEVCVPITARVFAELPPAGKASEPLLTALNDRPERGGEMTCAIDPIVDGLKVAVRTTMVHMPGEVAIVEASEAGLWISEATLSREGHDLTAVVEMVPPDAKPFALARSDVRLTILAEGRAFEFEGCD